MSDTTHVDFDPAPSKAQQRQERNGADGEPKERRSLKERIAKLPEEPRIDPAELKSKPEQRSQAAANLRLAGAPYHEIAKTLGYRDASEARAAVVSALAQMNPPEDLETLRQAAALRAELLFRQSFTLATATHLVDAETNEMVPNTDRLRWHEQAAKDLLLHTNITGAKAPARLEVSASTAELNAMVNTLLAAEAANGSGPLELEAEVWDIDDVELTDAEIVED